MTDANQTVVFEVGEQEHPKQSSPDQLRHSSNTGISYATSATDKTVAEFNRKLLDKISSHLSKHQHPLKRYLDSFQNAFLAEYKGLVDNKQ